MMTDPIADMLTRIRNAVRVERPHVDMPLSKVKRGLAEVLKREGYIWDWEEIEAAPARHLRVHLKYGPNGERVIRHLRRVSKPGRRVYSGATKLKPVLSGNSSRPARESRRHCRVLARGLLQRKRRNRLLAKGGRRPPSRKTSGHS
jgi:small subunit ribosomal protein S8